MRGGIRNIIQTNVFSRGGIIKAVRGDIRGTSKPGKATRVCRDKRVVQVCRQIFAVIYNVRYPTELSVRGGYRDSSYGVPVFTKSMANQESCFLFLDILCRNTQPVCFLPDKFL